MQQRSATSRESAENPVVMLAGRSRCHGNRRRGTSFLTPPFVISVVILAVVALGLPVATRYMQVVLTKDPIPLRKPLSKLNKMDLGPYQFVSQVDLPPAMIDALGTEEYIYWILEDRDYPSDSPDPRRMATLAVTYYTGDPDPVPHVPEICFRGSGYTELEQETRVFEIESMGDVEVPVRVTSFVKSGIFDRDTMTVAYTFHCNNQFAGSRNTVRTLLSDPRQSRAYFSKVEVSFGSEISIPRFPSREDVIASAEKLFSHVLPLLMREHWPSWDVEAEISESSAAE